MADRIGWQMLLIGDRRWMHILNAAFFGIAGVLLTLDLSFEAPSFWYLICSVLWIFAAPMWLTRPAWAAGFSIPPTIGLVILALRIHKGISLHDPGAIGTVIAVFIAIPLLVLSLFRSEKLEIFPAVVPRS